MRPLLATAVVLGVAAAVGQASRLHRDPGSEPVSIGSAPSPPAADLEHDCPTGTLPDHGVCVPVPASPAGIDPLRAQRGAHRNRNGEWSEYDQIPRRAERPAAYTRYRLPIADVSASDIVSGYDLHAADEYQRRGGALRTTGHGGVDVLAPRDTPVLLMDLESQQEAATVLYVGELFGTTVVTWHRVREASALRDYLVLYGHLSRPAPGLTRGATVDPGELVGLVGDSGSPGAVHLHLEIRQVRNSVDPMELGPHELANNARTVACDPRNLLVLEPLEAN